MLEETGCTGKIMTKAAEEDETIINWRVFGVRCIRDYLKKCQPRSVK